MCELTLDQAGLDSEGNAKPLRATPQVEALLAAYMEATAREFDATQDKKALLAHLLPLVGDATHVKGFIYEATLRWIDEPSHVVQASSVRTIRVTKVKSTAAVGAHSGE